MLFHGSCHIGLELRPLCLVLHEVHGALLAGHVVVADDILLRVQTVQVTQPRRQLHQRVVGLLCGLAVSGGMAELDGHGVVIPVVGAVGHLVQRHAQQGFALQPYDQVAAGGGLAAGGQIFKIGTVLPRGGVGVAHIVDHHCVDMRQLVAAAGVFVHRQQILLHIVRQGDAGGNVAFLLLSYTKI